jgi:Ca2+-binding RTX toxin-like protein
VSFLTINDPTTSFTLADIKADLPGTGTSFENGADYVFQRGILPIPSFGPTGSTTTITGAGFAASSTGMVWFDSNLNGVLDVGEPSQSVTSSGTGSFTTTLTIPTVPAFFYPIRADVPGTGTSFESSAGFRVTTSGWTGDVEAFCGAIGSYAAVITGTPGNDLLVATVRSIIIGDSGDDQIYGSPFDDCIIAEEGDDKVSAGDGNDKISGFDGNDNLKGGSGADTIFGENDMDTIVGGPGNDTIDGGAGDDSIKGDADNDNISGGGGNDRISGGDGNDTISGDADNDQITGRANNDNINCGTGIDIAAGDDAVAATNPGDVDIIDPNCDFSSPF